jgi:hypothetical protein
VIGGGKLIGELLELAQQSAQEIAHHYDASLRPHLARILVDAAAVEIRAASGEDVTTARAAVESSVANLAVEQKNIAVATARDLAFRAALSLIGKLLPVVAV